MSKTDNIELIRGDPKVAIRKLSVPTMFSMLLIMMYNAASHSIFITIILSIALPLILIPLLSPILTLMGAGRCVSMGVDYGNVVFLFMIVFLFASVASAILRAEGDVNRSMYAIAITAILNIIIDPIFIYVLHMGIVGAAWATVLSSLISCIVMGYWIWIKKDT